MNKFRALFESGVFAEKYSGIIEIYPRKAMNVFTLEAALHELQKTHDIIQLFPGHLRAFEKK